MMRSSQARSCASGLGSEVAYKSSVAKDLRGIDKQATRRILDRIEDTLGKNPNAGTALKGDFRGLFRYRIGEYRVIYSKPRAGVLILRIAHRKEAYR